MKSIKVDVHRMEVAKFHPKEPVEFKIFFNDGADKCLMYSSEMKNPVMDATAVLGKIKRYEKDNNKPIEEDHFLDGYCNVNLGDEEIVTEKIANFFKRVLDEKKKLMMQRDHTRYLSDLNCMMSLKVSFEK